VPLRRTGTSEANAYQTLAGAVSDLNSLASPGSILYIKRTASRIDEGPVNISVNGDGTATITIEGYTTTPGDNGMFEYGDYWDIDGDYVTIKNIDIEMNRSSTYGVLYFDTASQKGHLHNCKLYNTNTGNNATLRINTAAVISNCEIVSDGNMTTPLIGAIFVNSFDGAVISGNVIRGETGVGALPAFHGLVVEGNIFCHAPNRQMEKGIDLDMQSGTSQTAEGSIQNNTILTDNYGIHIAEILDVGEAICFLIKNNLIYGDGGGYGIYNADDTVTVGISIIGNAVGNMGGSSNHIYGFGTTVSSMDNVDLTADPFADKDNEDFRLNGISGGGAACRSSATPTTFKNMTFSNRSSIGAVGHDGLVERVSVI
jgi:putative cofactor-binding repeat protein